MAAYEVLLLNTAIPQIQAAQSGDTYVVPRDIAINATAIISANSATDALRITQVGAGNAILVEDSANPDSTPFVVTATGDVGIGTSAPSRKLDIALTPAAQVTGAAIRSVGGTTNIGDETSIDFQVFSSTYYNGRISGYVESITGNGKGGLKFYTSSAGTSINATPSVTLDSSGNLGLGVTPSAWSQGKAFEISAVGEGLWGNGLGDIWMVNGAYFNSGWKYSGATKATAYRQGAGTTDGSHSWFNAASGTAGNAISFTQAMTLDASGNLGIGLTTQNERLRIGSSSAGQARMTIEYNGSALTYFGSYLGIVGLGNATDTILASTGVLAFSAGGTTERARITSGGSLLVGATTEAGYLFRVAGGLSQFYATAAANFPVHVWNSAASGDNGFVNFYTDAGGTLRGSIDYDRTGGLVRYNTTSDYRAKDIIGPIQNVGATIDALKVYEGKMKGATQSRPMLVAHEAQEYAPYAVTGEKDAMNEDGTPKYQQMDVSSLVPLLLAELQSLRARVAQLEQGA